MAINRDHKKTGGGGGKGNSMVTGIVIGVFIGLSIALAVALYVTNAPSPFKAKEAATPAAPATPAKPGAPQAGAKPAPAAAADKDKDQKKFTFYDILPGSEQPVSEQDIKQQPQGSKDRYFLQAGSFQNEADANNLKARLALMGVEASIQSTNVPDKGVWHRVRVGPFNDVEEMNKARVTLTQNGIQPSLIKVQDAKP